MKEFELIDTFFKAGSYQRKDVVLGIGDDCAIADVPSGQSLVVTTDTLVSGVHFFADAPPEAIAHKAVAVNLSDLASMGAEPAWLSLSLSLPDADEAWVAAFSKALHALSEYYSIQLIGGDTVRGPLSVTITAHGFVPQGQALCRHNAKPGDLIYVTGSLGDAAAGLAILRGQLKTTQNSEDFLVNRLHYPTPRLLAGTAVRRIATAGIDISDGLLADLQHVLSSSGCGAQLHLEQLPLSVAMRESVPANKAYDFALAGGDDYELLFTVSADKRTNLEINLANFNVEATCIGQMTGKDGKIELRLGDEPYSLDVKGYEHFS
ncbi:thiamine-phosphate kinase [Aestuariibacter halophilus]|uniref:Thiamine-monophosphate kinase n=1 Tax=Fluctibacter halophilus TaxID=226011 RepID=A0ABS8G2G6_9ALTE|nr:thiamine-phosphate kinase [Aestuariibacter halophilus]MCC2614725.1 thiamine-phosphate kinase [Aestuariibacter halophilus]